MRRCVHLKRGLAVKPHAAAALVCVALAAERSVVEPVQLGVLYVEAAVKAAYGVSVVAQVERGADIKLAVWGERYVGLPCPAVVHLVEHHAVGQDVQLRRLAPGIHPFNVFCQTGQHVFVFGEVIIRKCFHVRQHNVQACGIFQQIHDGVMPCEHFLLG